MRKLLLTAVALAAMASTSMAATLPTPTGKGVPYQENRNKACETVTADDPCFLQFPKVPDTKMLRIDRVDCLTFGSNASDVYALWTIKPIATATIDSVLGAFHGSGGIANASGPYFLVGGQRLFIQGGGTDTTIVCTVTGITFDIEPA